MQSVLSNLVEVLQVFLKLGQIVSLEGFGSFRISVSSDGTATPEELNAACKRCKDVVFVVP